MDDRQKDNIFTISGVFTGYEGYGVFYPYDGLLSATSDEDEAREDVLDGMTRTLPEYKDAYVVRIKVERVES